MSPEEGNSEVFHDPQGNAPPPPRARALTRVPAESAQPRALGRTEAQLCPRGWAWGFNWGLAGFRVLPPAPCEMGGQKCRFLKIFIEMGENEYSVLMTLGHGCLGALVVPA